MRFLLYGHVKVTVKELKKIKVALDDRKLALRKLIQMYFLYYSSNKLNSMYLFDVKIHIISI